MRKYCLIMSNNLSIEFANARIKALEKNLLTKERLTRLIDCSDLSEALRILAEVNYGGGLVLDNPLLYDILLKEEEKKVTELVSSLIPDGFGFECFLMKNDYHNAKVYYKGRFTKGINVNAIKPQGIFEVESAISSRVYSLLPDGMQEVLVELDKLSDKEEITPRVIDLALDRAYFKDVFKILKRSKTSVIQEYFRKLVDYTNILTMARIRLSGTSDRTLYSAYIEGGELSLKELYELLNGSENENLDKYRYNKFAKVFSVVAEDNSLISLEKLIDDELIGIFKKEKNDMFSPAPIAGYYVGKLIEIKIVRLILVCLSNGVDRKQIRRRLRESYA